MLSVLVTGASGFLGRAVMAEGTSRTGMTVQGTAFSRSGDGLTKLDLNDFEGTKAFLEDYTPDVVVHCAAERKPDQCEKFPEDSRRLNVDSTRNLAKLAAQLQFSLIYISTDYVFNGFAPPGGYDVDDAPSPTNFYGQTKRDGELSCLEEAESGAKVSILRVPVLYGASPENSESAINVLLDAVRRSADKKTTTMMDDWATRFPTNTADVARVLIDLAELLQQRRLPSILHFSAQEPMTKFDIATLFASLHSPPLVTKYLESDAKGPQPGDTVRPRNCHLSNRALGETGVDCKAVNFRDWSKQFVQGIVQE
ncbi:hypothetical protein JCM5353_000209 [Sporobolomyces roseus]